MNEEPYRWLEAVENRREYVREQLKGGSPAFGVKLPDGILLVAIGSGSGFLESSCWFDYRSPKPVLLTRFCSLLAMNGIAQFFLPPDIA